jgi:nitrogen fixation NifU-like protein
MDIYREAILDHYKHPHNFGHLDKPDMVVEEGNVTCGDRIVMEINVGNDKTIADVRFSGEGCAISQASASMLTLKIKGMKLKDAMKLKISDIIEMLGTTLTPSRTKCATLSLEVLHKAISSQK